jgi:hypothetical protein
MVREACAGNQEQENMNRDTRKPLVGKYAQMENINRNTRKPWLEKHAKGIKNREAWVGNMSE